MLARLVFVIALCGIAAGHPLPGHIFFPGESMPIDPRSEDGAFKLPHRMAVEERSYQSHILPNPGIEGYHPSGGHSSLGSHGYIGSPSLSSGYHNNPHHNRPAYPTYGSYGTSNLGSYYDLSRGHESSNVHVGEHSGQPVTHLEPNHVNGYRTDNGVPQNNEESSYGGQHRDQTSNIERGIPSAIPSEVSAQEHRIVEQMKELAGIIPPQTASTKDPISVQQEIIREIKGLAEPNPANNGKEDIQKVFEEPRESATNQPTNGVQTPQNEDFSPPNRQEIEAPAVKNTDQGSLEAVAGSLPKKSTPDPLDLLSLYEDYKRGDYKPGSPKNVPEPKKELDPEVKKAIDNIMREWEVFPDTEGKPVPPPRNFKVTKHVKVTQTTHNNPVVYQPSQTVTKTVKTESYHQPLEHTVVKHHINIAELLEQLRRIEGSDHHRNITWCEEKIREFLTELNRQEERGVEITQTVQENTLHHILTQDQTITKEIRHEVHHDSRGVVEEPFQKKTVVELGLNEPTKPPSYWEHMRNETHTHTSIGGDVHPGGIITETEEHHENVQPGGAVSDIEEHHEHAQSGGGMSETEEHQSQIITDGSSSARTEEAQMFTDVPDLKHVGTLEALSHQLHGSLPFERNEPAPENESGKLAEVEEGTGNNNPGGETNQSIDQIPGNSEHHVEEFQGHREEHHRPLPPSYQPRGGSEEETEVLENNEEGELSHAQGIDELNIDLPEYGEHQAHEEKVEQTELEENPNHGENSQEYHSNGYYAVAKNEGTGTTGVKTTSTGTSSGHVNVEHVVHELPNYGHTGGTSTHVEETEYHTSGNERQVHEINYDQLIEELVSLESLPGHQAIDKCEEKIRQFLEVLKRQQERGFDQNQLELQRLRRLLEEIQVQKQSNPGAGAENTSFWKKVAKKITTTLQKAKTKAQSTVNNIFSDSESNTAGTRANA